MKKTIYGIYFILILFGLSLKINAQTLTEIINDENLNYNEKLGLIEKDGGGVSKVLNNAEEWEQKRYYRWKSYWDSRIDKQGSYDSFLREWQIETNNILNNKTQNKDKSFVTWEFVGPNESSSMKRQMGRIECVITDPLDQSIVYAGANTGGLWKCTNTSDPLLNWHWELQKKHNKQ